MPGGYGTLDELFESITLIQTKKILDFPVIVFDKEYHKEMMAHIQLMKEKGTISTEDDQLFFLTDSIEEAMQILRERSIKQFKLTPEKQIPLKWLFERNGKK
jgi:predicted Rossmann-fold nucleotide-binding protein